MVVNLDVLKKRKQCLVYQTSEKDSLNGWIGGNAPAYFDELEQIVNKAGDLSFYLAIVNPLNNDEMISIFVPKSFEERISKNRYPNCSLLTIKHKRTDASELDTFANPDLVKHFISEPSVISDRQSFKESCLIKYGGTPKHIQEEEYYYKELHDKGFQFIFQIDEDGYPDTLIKKRRSYPFAFGAVYLYAQILNDGIENPIESYWQYS